MTVPITLFVVDNPTPLTLRMPESGSEPLRAEWIVRRIRRQADDVRLVVLARGAELSDRIGVDLDCVARCQSC